MSNRRTHRVPMSIGLGFVFILIEIAALTSVGVIAWLELVSPSSAYLRYPFIHYAQLLQQELVIPVCGMRAAGGTLQTGDLVSLRCIDPTTGQRRDVDVPGGFGAQGLVSDGQRLWCFAARDVLEFDGTKIRTLQSKRPLGKQASAPFLHEGRPALIERNIAGNEHLVAFADEDWIDKGRIVLPGPNRKWVIDEETGQSVLVPLTSPYSLLQGTKWWVWVHVVCVHGEYHLFQSESASLSLCHRVGFDFVPPASELEAVSALIPENAPADTAGWEALDSKLAGIFGCSAAVSDELILANDKGLWRQVPSDQRPSSTKFERMTEMDTPPGSSFSLVSSANSQDVYFLAAPIVSDVQVYRLDNGRLQKLPYQIEGLGGPMQHWVGQVLQRCLVVLCAGSLMIVLIAAWIAGPSSYSFGHFTVILAPIVRRSLARCFDMVLALGPLAVQSYFLIQTATPESIMASLELEDLSRLSQLIPTVAWLVGVWSAIVITTGIWGVTPGKWLFRIRVIRATLRPCGMFRALLRELMIWCDMPFLLTAIPGVVCLLATENRQRIGDLVADTLVIDARVPMKSEVPILADAEFECSRAN